MMRNSEIAFYFWRRYLIPSLSAAAAVEPPSIPYGGSSNHTTLSRLLQRSQQQLIPTITSKAKLKFPNSPSNKTLAHTFHCIHGSNSVCSRRNVYVSKVLHADEKWILCAAYVALTVAAVSEISMPGILTATVYSAQNGDMFVFYQNSQLLIWLCFTSGICSGLRSGCFAIPNTVLVKRLRETLYISLLLQDISFFDKEAVGNLSSRISTDCQRLSHTIGNDIHLILRNIVQGIGAFITLMTLPWPLALSSLAVCVLLSAIFLIYGQ